MPRLTIKKSIHDRWRAHKNTWKNCKLCPLHETRQNVILCRGTIPCKVMFVGEAPGKTEDTIGYPFIGPSGQILQSAIEEAFPKSLPYAISNIVACIPLTQEKKIRKPSKDEVVACRPRLTRLLAVASPTTIVRVGKVSKTSLPDKLLKPYKVVDIVHPAYIMRQGSGTINYQVYFDRTVLQLKGIK